MLSTLFKQEVKIRELEKIDSPLYHASNRFCNKIAKKLEKLTPIFENENLKAYEHDNTIIVHFTDETLAKHLYSHHSDLRPFSVYKLVFNKWHKKLSFLICPYTHSKNVYWLKPDFQDLCDCINNFLNSICTDTFKVNINYYIFFELSCRKHFYYTLCLLFSLTTDDYTMSKEELDKTIEAIVYDSHTSAYGVIASILDNGQDILPWLKNGVYPNKSYNLESPFNLPSYFVMNLLKRKFNPNYYTDSLKFFENEYIQGATDYDYMVLDEELFNSYLGSSSQEGDFIKYTAQDGLVFLTSPQSDRLERIYDILNEYNLLNHVSLACNALVRQKYLFYNPKQLSKPISLESYIDTHVKSRANAISLITQIYETLYIKDINLWFKNKEDMFNTLCIRPTSKKLFIDNLHLICLESKEDCVAFDPYFIIMKVLKLLNDKGIFTYEMLCESDLYKVIPFKFIKSLEEYLTTEVYNEPDSKDEYAFISTDFAKNIEFLENLDTKSETFVSRVSFVPNIEQNEHIKNILSAREIAFANATFNFNGVKPICLDELLYNAANMPLTTSSLKKFIPIRDKQHRFFGATKVIVSKDYTINGNYQIIGVVWPKLKPYNLFELISKKAINTKQIYKVMLNFARCPNQAVKLLGNEYSILLTRDLFPVINWLEVSSLDEPYSSNHDDVENYNCIFDIIKLYTIKHWGYFEDFDYTVERFGDLTVLGTRIQELKYCKEHNLFYFAHHSGCKACCKLYDKYNASDILETEVLHETEFCKFHSFDDGYVHCFTSEILDEVIENIKLGILNDVYSNFVGVTPSRIILHGNKYFGVTLEDEFDFEGAKKASDFISIKRLKFILMLYKQLLPRINDYSFLCDNKEIFDNMLMHSDFKGHPIIPNIFLLDTKAITSNNNDYKEEMKNKTLAAFSSFLHDYILEDEYLKAKIDEGNSVFTAIIDSIVELNFDANVIQNCVTLFKNYCFTHNCYFSSEDTICPLCINDGIKKDNMLFLPIEHYDALSTPMYDGGEANLYRYSNTEVQKLFKPGINLKFKSEIIGKVLEKKELFEKFNAEHKDIKFVMINKVLYSSHKDVYTLRGYTQNNIVGSFKISNLKDREFVNRIGYTTRDIVNILVNVCIGIEFIHKCGGFIGDLNGGNILIKDKVVYFIDFDGMSFDEVKNFVYTNMYIYPPSAENKNITKDDDWYSLAVQSFYYLTYSHPFRGICRNPDVPQSEIERMKLGLSVLGNHGINPPSINIGWDHLPKNLIDFFISTFEDKTRKSMLSILKAYLDTLPTAKLKLTEIKRNNTVLTNISENTYLGTDRKLYHKEKALLKLSSTGNFYIVDNMIWCYTGTSTILLNDDTGKLTVINKKYDKILSVLEDKIFYMSNSSVFVDKIFAPDNIVISPVDTKISSTDASITLKSNSQDKILYVVGNVLGIDIYGNSTKLYTTFLPGHSKTRIEYDQNTNTWLVLLIGTNDTKCIVISPNKEPYSFDIHETISSGTCLYRNTLYYTKNGKICYCNINTKKASYMPCDVATDASLIQRRDNKFVICNGKTCYVYTKS